MDQTQDAGLTDTATSTTMAPLVPTQYYRPYHCQKWLKDGKGDVLAEVSASGQQVIWTWGLISWDAYSPLYHVIQRQTY